MSAPIASIHYRRLPDREQLFEQEVVEHAGDYIVTFAPEVKLPRPVLAGGRTILESGSPIVWFTYPGRWHDLGRFHLRDGTFTGYYANILTPVEVDGLNWRTTDLCLDVWIGADGRVEILDEDEFEEARERGWMDEPTALRARAEADELADAARLGLWPPPHAHEWELDRARQRLTDTR